MPTRSNRAREYLRMARDYASAATELFESGAYQGCRLPFFMLVAHALELSLKAVLSAAGADEERLMGIGHELDGCFRMALQTGLYPRSDPVGVANLIQALVAPHTFQAFRYPQPFGWALPEPGEANGTLHRHLDVVAEAITRQGQVCRLRNRACDCRRFASN